MASARSRFEQSTPISRTLVPRFRATAESSRVTASLSPERKLKRAPSGDELGTTVKFMGANLRLALGQIYRDERILCKGKTLIRAGIRSDRANPSKSRI